MVARTRTERVDGRWLRFGRRRRPRLGNRHPLGWVKLCSLAVSVTMMCKGLAS